MSVDGPRCAIAPLDDDELLREAVTAGGGSLVDPADAEAIIWADPTDPGDLRALLDTHTGIRWVQLPYAGIEPFADVLDDRHLWTSGKGVYAEPVAEHVLALALAGMRGIGRYARRRAWSEPYGTNLLGARVTILGGGAITEALLRLLAPFRCRVTVVRRRPDPMQGALEVVDQHGLDDALAQAELVVLALALTPETRGIIDAHRIGLLGPGTWLVNVARGGHVDTDALVEALGAGRLGGAALDVTDPEPLPDGHPLWSLDNCIITPHVGNTPEMGRPLLANRVRENVARYAAGEQLLGPVHTELGY